MQVRLARLSGRYAYAQMANPVLLPFRLHVQHHYRVYQFSNASKARRPPGHSAVPSVEPQVTGNIININSSPSPADRGAEALPTPARLLFDSTPLCFNSEPASEHCSRTIRAHLTRCADIVKRRSEGGRCAEEGYKHYIVK